MKVYIQIVNTTNGISQNGMIDEPVKKGSEIANALGHFGISINDMKWDYDVIRGDMNNSKIMAGIVSGTTKVVNIVCVG